MGAEQSGDLDTMLGDDFGQQATHRPQAGDPATVWGVLDASPQVAFDDAGAGLEVKTITFTCALADLTRPARGDSLVIGATWYRVVDMEDDGAVLRLTLEVMARG